MSGQQARAAAGVQPLTLNLKLRTAARHMRKQRDAELGDGTMTERHAPVQVANARNAVAINGGSNHSVAAAQPGRSG